MDAVKVCSEWLQTAAKQLEAARRGDKETDADVLLAKLGSIRVITAAGPACNHVDKPGANMPKFLLIFHDIL